MRVKITNLQQAISHLGMKQICNLAMTASVSSLFRQDAPIGTYSREQLWKHLVAVGIGARMIARRMRLGYFEDVFLAGLLHDLGIILEDQHLHDAFVNIIRLAAAGRALAEIERAQLGFDHTMLGEQVALLWKLPNGVADTVRYHHGSAACQEKYRKTVQCVEMANYLCTAKGHSAIGLPLVAFPADAISAFDLKKEDLLVLAEDLEQELNANQTLFHV